MELIFASIVQNAIKFIFFIIVAWAGIVCGKKYKCYKESKTAEASAKSQKIK